MLLVDDDPAMHSLVEALVDGAGFAISGARTGAEAVAAVRAGFSGVVLLDVRLPDVDGTEVFGDLRGSDRENPVVFLTGHGSTRLALDAIREGAFDFIEKDDLKRRIVPTLEAAWDAWRRNADRFPGFEDIVTRSPAMHAVFRAVENLALSDVPVLLRGESGTGKELIARAIHRLGPRSHHAFVGVNCGGIPHSLLEAELFGYEKGAFTGAELRKPGRFDDAHGGTLLFDEVGELPVGLQAKLLRVLQEREYRRLGGVESTRADVRIISATNRDLEAACERGAFREDLYYRLAVFTVSLPPLRERVCDMPLLVDHFVAQAADREGKTITGVDSRAMEILGAHRYPGNVRQLENVLSFAVLHATTPEITLADLPPDFLAGVSLATEGEPAARASATWNPEGFPTLRVVEQEHIRAALELCRGNRVRAARLLGISRTTLYRKIEGLEA